MKIGHIRSLTGRKEKDRITAMNNETCKCDSCRVEIPANLGMKETRIFRMTNTTYTVDLCEDCWYASDEDGEEDELWEGLSSDI